MLSLHILSIHAGSNVDTMQQLPHYSRVPRLLRLSPDAHGFISASTISQKHISLKVEGSYPVVKARELIETAAQLGFGTIEEVVTPQNKRKVTKFKKTNYTDLSPSAKELLAKWDINRDIYASSTVPDGHNE